MLRNMLSLRYVGLCLVFVSVVAGLNFTLAGKCSCPAKIEPVCGSVDGVPYTFMNHCVFNCTTASKPERIYHYDGVCCRLERCNPFENPVCDEHGRAFATRCLFDQAQCVELRQNKRHLKLDMSSPNCRCVKQCTPKKEPVCDTDGYTHTNMCAFLNAKCIAKMVHDKTLEIDYMGTCCENLCTASYSSLPVCDSENNTHPHLCSFLKHRCERSKRYGKTYFLGFKAFGACKIDPSSRHFSNIQANIV
uniref:Kazal-like domain-containing protein n=1 Tax=Panagrellus redivivus TaxID=6233 RepID=A0A7E4VKX1_PANRE